MHISSTFTRKIKCLASKTSLREARFFLFTVNWPFLLNQPDEKYQRGYEYCVIARLSRNKREPVTMTPFLSFSARYFWIEVPPTTGWDHEFQIFRGDANTEAVRTVHVWIPAARRKFTSNYDAKSRFRHFNRLYESFSTRLMNFLKSRENLSLGNSPYSWSYFKFRQENVIIENVL